MYYVRGILWCQGSSREGQGWMSFTIVINQGGPGGPWRAYGCRSAGPRRPRHSAPTTSHERSHSSAAQGASPAPLGQFQQLLHKQNTSHSHERAILMNCEYIFITDWTGLLRSLDAALNDYKYTLV